jgi:hypothetical protein
VWTEVTQARQTYYQIENLVEGLFRASAKMGRTTAFNVALAFTILAFLFELLGLFTPLWFITDIIPILNTRTYTGLWFITIDGDSTAYSKYYS